MNTPGQSVPNAKTPVSILSAISLKYTSGVGNLVLYLRLEPSHIVLSAHQLRKRINERFHDSGLSRVAEELEGVVREASQVSQRISRPNWKIRIGSGLAALVVTLGLGFLFSTARVRLDLGGISDFVQGVEAFTQSLVLLGAAMWSLMSVENRWKRNQVLKALRVLRSLAHVVDMHQLTKHPEQMTAEPTASSPVRTMDSQDLLRYLDYSSEMLALISKVSAIYVQDFHDADSVEAAADIEDLTGGLSRSIWQKIVIITRDLGP